MDWIFRNKFTGLNPQQVQLKVDELNKIRPTIPVCRHQELRITDTYTIETWFHFKANTLLAIIYRDIIYDGDTPSENSV